MADKGWAISPTPLSVSLKWALGTDSVQKGPHNIKSLMNLASSRPAGDSRGQRGVLSGECPAWAGMSGWAHTGSRTSWDSCVEGGGERGKELRLKVTGAALAWPHAEDWL